ncbi:class I SAM-dependent methyltransferase [Saccharopolyspora sp. NPDC047091]|uniref:class I SAM-dependent methyltransferase n=1 Tax=Saccharopolyspora sp. NPDC047091 TaxID=3155924 RepID=UPI0033C360B1
MTDRAIEAVRDNWTQRAAAYNDFYERYAQDKREAWRAVCDKAVHAAFPERSAPLRVLDVGTGTGFLSTLLAELGHEVTAVDPSPAMLGYAREEARRRGVEVRFAECGGHDVREVAGDGGFDLVSARYVLWTLPEPVRALRAWRQVLNPGGALLLADGVWHGWRHDARRVLASLRPGADHGYLLKVARDYRKIGRATPNWSGLTAAKTADLLRAAGFAAGERLDHLLPEYAHPSSAAFHLRTARPRTGD